MVFNICMVIVLMLFYLFFVVIIDSILLVRLNGILLDCDCRNDISCCDLVNVLLYYCIFSNSEICFLMIFCYIRKLESC